MKNTIFKKIWILHEFIQLLEENQIQENNLNQLK